jgi:hypothetical protein
MIHPDVLVWARDPEIGMYSKEQLLHLMLLSGTLHSTLE